MFCCLLQKVSELEVALKAQEDNVAQATSAVREAERNIFTVEKRMHTYVDKLEDSQAIFDTQIELDSNRYICFIET